MIGKISEDAGKNQCGVLYMKKLYRSDEDKILGGVCGGLGEYFDIDPTLVRLIFILLGLHGSGVILYLVAWLLIPKKPKQA